MPLGRRHTTVGTGRVTPAEAAVSTVPPVMAGAAVPDRSLEPGVPPLAVVSLATPPASCRTVRLASFSYLGWRAR